MSSITTATLPKTVAEASTLEDAYTAYLKTPGSRHAVWNGNCTFSKFKRRFGKAFGERTTAGDATTSLLEALQELITRAAQGATITAPVVAAPEAPAQNTPQVQPQNELQPPTNKMLWLLRCAAIEAGIGTSWKCPVFRKQASELIGKVKAAGDDKQAIKRLLQA